MKKANMRTKKNKKTLVLSVLSFFIVLAMCTSVAAVSDYYSNKSVGLKVAAMPKDTVIDFDIPNKEPEPEISEKAYTLLNDMTVEEKVYQMFMITPEQLLSTSSTVTSSGSSAKTAIETYPVGGVIYFGANIKNPTQCTDMISNLQSYSKTPLFIAVDEEGGSVARIGNNENMGTTQFPNMGSIESADEAYNVGYTIGTEIKQFGFNLDFAPVADVDSNPNNTVIGNRAFSSDPNTAAEYVAAAVKGFNDAGMLCTLKHFPGHGDTDNDTHYGYAEVTKTLDELKECELLPFQSGIKAGADFVMLGHLAAPKITGDTIPASLSKPLIDLLRNEVGFNGIVITDAMRMDAIVDDYYSDEAAILAVQAGVDIILLPNNFKKASTGVINAVNDGTISEERINQSVLKILQKKIDSGIIK